MLWELLIKIWDNLFMDKNLILKAQREFEEKRGKNFTYNPLIGDRAPALNYRK